MRGVKIVGVAVVCVALAGIPSMASAGGHAEAGASTVALIPDATYPPPPAPTVRLRRGGRAVRTFMEQFCGPRGDGHGSSCAIATPAVGSRFPRLPARAGRMIVVNTQLDASSVRVELVNSRGVRVRSPRVRRLDTRRWQFAMPGRKQITARFVTHYAHGGDSRALIELRRASS